MGALRKFPVLYFVNVLSGKQHRVKNGLGALLVGQAGASPDLLSGASATVDPPREFRAVKRAKRRNRAVRGAEHRQLADEFLAFLSQLRG